LRGVVPSKVLLLRAVMCDDNLANNGGIFYLLKFLRSKTLEETDKRQYRGKLI